MFRNRFTLYRLRHVMLADTGGEGGSGNHAGQQTGDGKPDGDGDDRSKEFSHALAKRAAEIEAKYSDYEELKAKAAKYDERESESKSDMDKLNERLTAIEKERDELKAAETRRTLVDKVAKDAGIPADAVAMLSGDDEATLKEHADALAKLIQTSKPKRRGAPPAARNTEPPHDGDMSAMDLLRGAYSD